MMADDMEWIRLSPTEFLHISEVGTNLNRYMSACSTCNLVLLATSMEELLNREIAQPISTDPKSIFRLNSNYGRKVLVSGWS